MNPPHHQHHHHMLHMHRQMYYTTHPSQRMAPTVLRCYPISEHPQYSQRDTQPLDYGGKALLPYSFMYRAMFESNFADILLLRFEALPTPSTTLVRRQYTQCGIKDFCAVEGQCHLPAWMIRQLKLGRGEPARVKFISSRPPVGTFALLQPISRGYFNPTIVDLRAALEQQLANYQCLTSGDEIAIKHHGLEFNLRVRQLKPADFVTIANCDLNVDLDLVEVVPITAIEDEHKQASAINSDYTPAQLTFMRRSDYKSKSTLEAQKGLIENRKKLMATRRQNISAAFTGTGYRLDGGSGISSTTTTGATEQQQSTAINGRPNMNGSKAAVRKTDKDGGPPH